MFEQKMFVVLGLQSERCEKVEVSTDSVSCSLTFLPYSSTLELIIRKGLAACSKCTSD